MSVAWWALGSVVVVGGGIGAYFLLRPKETVAGGTGAGMEMMGAGGGGGGGGPSQGYSENFSYGGQGGSGGGAPTTASIAGGVVGNNAGSVSVARDVVSKGGRDVAFKAEDVNTRRPQTGLAGMDTSAIAASRNRSPATGIARGAAAVAGQVQTPVVAPTFVKAAYLNPGYKQTATTVSALSTGPSVGPIFSRAPVAAPAPTPAPKAPPKIQVGIGAPRAGGLL